MKTKVRGSPGKGSLESVTAEFVRERGGDGWLYYWGYVCIFLEETRKSRILERGTLYAMNLMSHP